MFLAGVPLIPELFLEYWMEEIQDRNAFVRSGLLQTNAKIQEEFARGGKTCDLPFFGDLTGDSEVDSDTVPSNPDQISGNTQTGVALRRRKSWSSSDLAADIMGTDPSQAIARRTGQYWVREMQKSVRSIMIGLFATGGPLATSHSVGSTTTEISQALMIDAYGRLGDASDRLTGVIMHSDVFRALLKLDLIVPASKNSQIDTRLSAESPDMPTYLGRPVFQDDNVPYTVNAGPSGQNVYRTFFFGPGAFGYANIFPKHAVEPDRDTLLGVDLLVNRNYYLVHPDGISWKSPKTANPSGPTNGELENPEAWEKVYTDDRNIRLSQMICYV